MFSFPLLLTLYAGFAHAFEADHLLGVGNIVSQRDRLWPAMKDGAFWGLGHSSTIFIIGLLMLVFKVGISKERFHYFEAAVGVMLMVLAVQRLIGYARTKETHHHFGTPKGQSKKANQGVLLQVYSAAKPVFKTGSLRPVAAEGLHELHPGLPVHSSHKLAYGVGLVHGLAGSGALVVLVMAQMKSPLDGLMYLFTFSTGAIGGMLVAAGLLSVPFSKKLIQARGVQTFMVILTSALCLIYGAKIIYENLPIQTIVA